MSTNVVQSLTVASTGYNVWLRVLELGTKIRMIIIQIAVVESKKLWWILVGLFSSMYV